MAVSSTPGASWKSVPIVRWIVSACGSAPIAAGSLSPAPGSPGTGRSGSVRDHIRSPGGRSAGGMASR